MILGVNTLFSDDQNLAQVAGSYYSDYIDLKSAALLTSRDAPSGVVRDPGKGVPLGLVGRVTTAFTSGGAATLVVSIETDDNSSFSSPTALHTSKTFALADLIVGCRVLPSIMPIGAERYVRIKYVIGTATTTAGKIKAGIGDDQSNR
jgi:hypothetical protein